MSEANSKAYHVEVDGAGCPHCGHMKLWVVVDPGGYAGGTSYANQDEAEEIAKLQNEAFEAGRSATHTAIGDSEKNPQMGQRGVSW